MGAGGCDASGYPPISITPVEVAVQLAQPADEDEVRNLTAILSASHSFITVQALSASSYDAKLVGLLAFHGALIAAAVTVLATVGIAAVEVLALSVMLVFLVVASATCIAGLVTPSDPDAGPEPKPFYDRFGGNQTTAMLGQLVGDLRAAIDVNSTGLDRRKQAVKRSLAVLAAGAVMAAAIVALGAAIDALSPRAAKHSASFTTRTTGVTSISP